MRVSKFFILCATGVFLGVFGLESSATVSEASLYEFYPATTKTVTTEVKTEIKNEDTNKSTVSGNAGASTEKTESSKILISEKNTDEWKEDTKEVMSDSLLADAETLIRDKMIQKYQTRLDELVSHMIERLTTATYENKQKFLTDMQKKVHDKKIIILEKKNLDPLKKDITITLLDHLLLRIEGLLKQSAIKTTTSSARA